MKIKTKAVASGKFILFGEHFVVPMPGQETTVPAIAFPISELFCEIRASLSTHALYSVQVPGSQGDKDIIESFMARATYAAGSALGIDVSKQCLKVESKTNFPISRGFGSSAAFAVALVRALEKLRLEANPNAQVHGELELFKAAQAVEKIFHGNPSGVDTAVIFTEKPILFENGMVQKTIENKSVDFVLLDSGSRDSCATLVSKTAQIRTENPELWNKFARKVRDLVVQGQKGLEESNIIKGAKLVASAVRETHGILSELDLSTPEIESLIQKAEAHGALAGKVSGAGKGGAVVLVAEKGKGKALADSLAGSGYPVLALVKSL